MQTLLLRKPLKKSPNLERMNLITKYNSYLKLVKSGIYRDHAMAMVQIRSIEQLQKAESLYSEI
jgi:hypothetical protein